MKTFRCRCGNRLFFDNTRCLVCARQVGFSAEDDSLLPLADDEVKAHGRRPLRACKNYDERGLCNWLVPVGRADGLCLACRLNVEVPESGQSVALLRNAELAKRRLIYSLLGLGLPVVPKREHEAGVGFALRQSAPDTPVTMGHDNGLITLDLNEADPARRAEIRAALGEDYRTLLGHFRHEIGHYYWTLFFTDEASRAELRELFGDERADYQAALAAHYAHPQSDYQSTHISSYATSHPWEDWAETFSHYLHILDSWETAAAFGLRTEAGDIPSRSEVDFSALLERWAELMIALNSLNRSMGHHDAYPFSLAPLVRTKLSYLDRTVHHNARRLLERFPPVPCATGSD